MHLQNVFDYVHPVQNAYIILLNIHKRLPKYLTNEDKDAYHILCDKKLVHSLCYTSQKSSAFPGYTLLKKGVTVTPKVNHFTGLN